MDPAFRSRRPLRRIALAALGAAALIASLVALPSAATAAPTTTLRGTVTVAGHAVRGVQVGTWSPSTGVLATGLTDSRGRFRLASPSGVQVVAYAGAKPSASKAVFSAGDEHLVRGVIGASAPSGVAPVLQQRVTGALPGRLGGGHALRFRLQEAGRFTASSPVLGAFVDTTGEIQLQYGTQQFGARYVADAAGTVTSGWLVPGRYRLLWNGNALPDRTWLTVRAGATVAAPAPAFRAGGGATISIHVTSGGAPVPAGVQSVRVAGSAVNAVRATDATGTIVQRGVTPGTYRFIVGQAYDDPDEGLDGPPSSDDYLTRSVTVRVAKGATTASATVDLRPASKVSGTLAAAPGGDSVSILVEDAKGVVVRSASTDFTGAFGLGGLPAGAYTVFAVVNEQHRYDAERVVLPEAASASDAPTVLARSLAPTRPELVVQGTVRGARTGYVSLLAPAVHGAVLYGAHSRIGSTGTYRIRTIPGRLAPLVRVDGRVDRTFALRTWSAGARRNLVPGARTSTVVGRFAVGGHLVSVGVQARGAKGLEADLTPIPRKRSIARQVAPGRYTWGHVLGSLPVVDGPWYYSGPVGSFTVGAGTTVHLATKQLVIRG